MSHAPAAIEARLRQALAVALGHDDAARASLLYVNGWRMDLSMVTALVFPATSDTAEAAPLLVAKLGRGASRARVRVEHDNLARLAASASDDFRRTVPAPVAWLESEEAVVLLESVVPGRPVPFPRGAAVDRLVERATAWLLLFHAATSQAAPAPLDAAEVERLFRRPLARYLELFAPGPAERRFLERALDDVGRLDAVPFPRVLQHGDLCPQNLLEQEDRLGVIDWEIALQPLLPAYDLIHLLACLGGPPGEGDGFRLYERAFFDDNPQSRASRRALESYAARLGLEASMLRLLFTLYWVEYALEKVEALGAGAGPDSPPGDLGVWSLARFDGGTCLNLKVLAEKERSCVFS